MFDLIEKNKRDSWLLVLAFVAILVGLGWLAAVGLGTGPWVLAVAAGFSLVSAVVTYAAGDRIVLGISGAKPLEKKDDPRLFNVVEELSIAAGVPMPRVYVIEDSAPNAFATGRSPARASVAVTRGLLEKLNRDELQGVIGHELSHVRNYDILFSMMIGILVGMVAMLSDLLLRHGMWAGRRRRGIGREAGGGGEALGLLFLVAAVLLALFAPLFAKLLQLAVSRQREYLADASSVELTRNPLGLAGALEKIAADKEVLEVANRATQHLYIVNPIKPFEERAKFLFSTHPPILERVRRLRRLAGEDAGVTIVHQGPSTSGG